MAAKATTGAPQSVAEGLGNVLRAISDTMTAPDATPLAHQLMKLQADTLVLIHGKPGGGPGGPPPGGGAPAPPPGGGLTGGISGLQGGPPQGPSGAAGGGVSPSGADAENVRQMVASGADQQAGG